MDSFCDRLLAYHRSYVIFSERERPFFSVLFGHVEEILCCFAFVLLFLIISLTINNLPQQAFCTTSQVCQYHQCVEEHEL
jgi:hypothetical protein